MEKQLYDAITEGLVYKVHAILGDHPDLDVNWQAPNGRSLLHIATIMDHTEAVSLLLAHPDINVNVKDANNRTPFYWGCCEGRSAAVRLLLKDPRVQINATSHLGYSGLRWAAFKGHVETVKWLIASGRELNLGREGNERDDALGQAKRNRKTGVIAVLEKFKLNPHQTRYELRAELGLQSEMAAELFALVVLCCDGYLRLREPPLDSMLNRHRVFMIARRLPMELQMIFCHRVVGSMRNNVTTGECEAALKDLVKRPFS